MIPLAVPNLSGNEAQYLQECIRTTFVSSVGPFVDRFETELAAYCQANAAVACASGTAALHTALHVCGVEPGSLVIMPSWTFIATANAVSQCNAVPWLFDVEEESWCLDPRKVFEALKRDCDLRDGGVFRKKCGRRVSAILPVYTLGHPADMDAFREICDSFSIPLIADAAAALGASYKSNGLGKMKADLSCLSFNGNKIMTSGGGGAIVGNDEALLSRAKHLTTTARSGADYTHDEAGFNYRMTNVEAAIGCAQLERIDAFVSSKQQIDQRYRNALLKVKGSNRNRGESVTPFPLASWAFSNCWLTGVVLETGDLRDGKIVAAFHERGVGARPFWKPMHLQSPYAHAPLEPTPITDALWPRVLTLPCSTNLSLEEGATVIRVAEEVLLS